MKVHKPRPEFGKPETGLARHWFRTDAQMRRFYMNPEQREQERQRISRRRAQMKRVRAEQREHERRMKHRHGICQDCAGGLVDVGVLAVKGERTIRDRDKFQCCICLAPLAGGPTKSMPWGPNRTSFRCRVLDPDPDVAEA